MGGKGFICVALCACRTQAADEAGTDENSVRSGRQNSKTKNASAVPFVELVGGDVQFEVCRSFLSMLQLVNNGNLDIVSPKLAGKSAGLSVPGIRDLKLVLLSSKVANISDYRAPSQQDDVGTG